MYVHLGINRKSMYAEFGSKQELFEAALEQYDKMTVGRNSGPLETPRAGLSKVERAATDKAPRRFVDRYFERLTDAFENALDNAQRAGEIDLEVDTTAQARFLTSAVSVFQAREGTQSSGGRPGDL